MVDANMNGEWVFVHPAPSPRMRFAAAVAFGQWWGRKVVWRVEGGEASSVQLHIGGRFVASWPCLPWMRETTESPNNPGSAPLVWRPWRSISPRFGAVCLNLPCASDATHLKVEGEEGEDSGLGLGWDVLGVVFYALSLWGERTSPRDSHGRPLANGQPLAQQPTPATFGGNAWEAGLQHRLPWVECMVAVWVEAWTEGAVVREGRLTWGATFDVDVAFKHLGRASWKAAALNVRDLCQGRLARVRERWKVRRGHVNDPYDSFGWVCAEHRVEPLTWFVLASDRNPPFDVGLNPDRRELPALVERLSWHEGGARVHWHPGHKAMSEAASFAKERRRVASWRGMSLETVRAHFLRSEPCHWPRLVAADVKRDASLGWAREVGFRAGTSRPFPAYDVETEATLPLTVEPLAAMDSALQALGLKSLNRCEEVLVPMMEAVAAVGGRWVNCWHNTSVSEHDEWQGWRSTYVGVVAQLRRRGEATFGDDLV